MNSDYDISMLKYVKDGKYTAYKAYDVFNGKKTDLTENVEIAAVTICGRVKFFL